MLTLTFVTKQDQWNSILAALPNAHVLQSWEWGEFKSRWGWDAERLLWLDQDQPVAAAQILVRSIPRTPWCFLYASKGPALDYGDRDLVEEVLAALEIYAKQRRSLFIKIDPDVVRQYGAPGENVSLDVAGQDWLQRLKRRGWRYSPEQIQFPNTVVIDLAGESKEWLARMKSKWRYNIRLASRKGVTVRNGEPADLSDFFQMYTITARRDGFLTRPQAYYEDVWRLFLETGQAEVLLAEVDGQVVAGLILFVFGQRAWYLYGASSGEQRQLMPNHLLQWKALQRAKALGCTHYDLWGAPNTFDESDAMWGVYRFKQGFGGQTIQGLGAYDFPVRPNRYWAFTQALPRARSLLRRLREQ